MILLISKVKDTEWIKEEEIIEEEVKEEEIIEEEVKEEEIIEEEVEEDLEVIIEEIKQDYIIKKVKIETIELFSIIQKIIISHFLLHIHFHLQNIIHLIHQQR